MTDLLQCLVGLALCAFGLYRWRAVRGEQAAAAQRYVHRSVFCLGIALIVLAPATARAVEHTVAMPGLPMLMGDQLRMLAASCLGLLAARSARRHVITTALTLVTMVVLFSAADLHHASGELFVDVRRRPFLAAYNTVIILFPAWHLVALVRVTLRRARRAEAGVQRVGLRLFCAGVALGVVWTAWGLDDIRLALSSGRQTDGEDAVSTVLGLVCATLVIAGGSTSAWTPLRHWWWARRTCRALTPLWSALHGEFPQIALQSPRHGLRIGQVTPRAVRFALYRRVIEIHDGLLLLRPRMEKPPPGEPVTAATRAAAIAAALGRTRALNAPGSPAPAPESAYRPVPADADDDAGEVGTDAEASQLAAISRCFAGLTGPVQRRREDVPV